METYESCQAGEGHTYLEPAVRFYGGPYAGFKALSVAMMYDLPVSDLRRIWGMIDGEPTGPYWEIVFATTVPESAYTRRT